MLSCPWSRQIIVWPHRCGQYGDKVDVVVWWEQDGGNGCPLFYSSLAWRDELVGGQGNVHLVSLVTFESAR